MQEGVYMENNFYGILILTEEYGLKKIVAKDKLEAEVCVECYTKYTGESAYGTVSKIKIFKIGNNWYDTDTFINEGEMEDAELCFEPTLKDLWIEQEEYYG